jgi:tetratricopeptide (TPR) repeat protein
VAADPKADVVNVTDAAWGLYMAGRRDLASATTDKALAIDPKYGNAHHLKGWLALTSGRYAAAALHMRRAYELTPSGFGAPQQLVASGDLAALYYAGVAEAAAGRRDSAMAAWREVVAQCERALAPNRSTRRHPVERWATEQALVLSLARLGEPRPDPAPLANDEITTLLQAAKLHAVLGRADLALDELRRGVALGAGDLQHLRDDPNFDAIRSRPEFRRILGPFEGSDDRP